MLEGIAPSGKFKRKERKMLNFDIHNPALQATIRKSIELAVKDLVKRQAEKAILEIEKTIIGMLPGIEVSILSKLKDYSATTELNVNLIIKEKDNG